MDRVFISHVAEDSALALRLAQGLEAAGFATWYYERDSLHGPSYLSQIVHALNRSGAVLALLSPDALASWQVDKEVVQAHERGLPFLPLLYGLTYEQMRTGRPEWAMAFGAAVALPLSAEDVAAVLPQIIAGLRWLAGEREAIQTAPADVRRAVDTAAAGQAMSAPQRFDNLPAPPTALLGRDQAVAQLAALLGQPAVRLVTLTGPGGVGKTRLAIAVAQAAQAAFAGGVCFVDLAPLTDPALVLPTMAQTLGVKEGNGQSVAEALRERALLLLLDNLEQVVEAAPDLAALSAECPHLTVLATSRVPLHLRGEREIAVPPLAVPDPAHLPAPDALAQVPAVALFVARAQEARAGFALSADTAPAVAAICARLDGLPLALELAAARVRLFPPPALLSRLSNRLALLTGGARDLPERQQTLRATIDWSYGLLSPEQQALLARLGVFAGGATLSTIEAVCAPEGEPDVVAGLEALLANSLLSRHEAEDELRVTMLETLREYARERLAERGEEEQMQAAHAAYYLGLAEEAEPALRGPDQAAWLAHLEREHDNMRAALAWAEASTEAPVMVGERRALPARDEMGLRLARALWQFWLVRGHLSEGRYWLEEWLSRTEGVVSAARAHALDGAGVLAQEQGDLARAQALYRESLALWRELGDRTGIAASLHDLGNVAQVQGDYEQARILYQESLALRRESGDRSGIATSLSNLGAIAGRRGDYEQARALYQESLAMRRELGDRWGIARSLNNLGVVAEVQGDYEQAWVLHEENLALRRELGDRSGIAVSLNNLGVVAEVRGSYEQAWALYEESLVLQRELGDRSGIAMVLNNLGEVARHQDDYGRAGALYEESLALRRELGDKQGIAETLHNLGRVAHGQGDEAQATALIAEALTLCRALGDRPIGARCLEGLAAVAMAQGLFRRAARLLGSAAAVREAIGESLPPNERAGHDAVVRAVRAALGEVAFDDAWAAGRALSWEQAVAEAVSEPPADREQTAQSSDLIA